MSQEFRKVAPLTRTIKSFPVPEIQESFWVEGQRHFISHTDSLGVVKMMLWFPHGISEQKHSFVASAAYELLLSGGNGKTEKDIVGYLDHLGANVQFDCELYGATATIRCSKERAVEVLKWVTDHILSCEFPEKEFDNYRLIKKASIERKMQTPQYWSSRIASENYYGSEHLLGKHGKLEDVENLKRNDVIAFHKEHIHPGKSMLLVAGDCNNVLGNELLSIHNEYFKEKFNLQIGQANIASRLHSDTIYTHELPNSTQVSLQLLKHVGHLEEHDLHKFTLLNMVLGGYFGSRLMQEIREEKGLTYGIGSYFRPAMDGRSWIISGEMNSENAQLALDCVIEIIEKLRNTLIDSEELERAKRYYSGQFRSGFDGPFSNAAKVQQRIMRNYSETFYKDTLSAIWTITPEEILEVAKNYLDPNTFIKVMAGKIK